MRTSDAFVARPLLMRALVSSSRTLTAWRPTWAIPTLVVLACGPAPDRREYGDQWRPPPDTLGGVDFDDGALEEESTGTPLDVDEGPTGDGPGADDEPPAADDGHTGDGIDTTGPPAADSGDDGALPQTPYQGGWDVGDCQDEVVATGTQIGQVVPDFQLKDQFGDTVRLYDFCHKAVFITDGAFW